MNVLLIKIFATALALSQVTTRPDGVKTQFDPVQDRAEVAQLLTAGCAHMRKTFDIEDLNLDDLISTAMDDPKMVTGEIKAFKGINFSDLHAAYRQFCKGETVENSPVDLGEVITFYNKAVSDLPDHAKLKGLKLPGMSRILDISGTRFAEVFTAENRRVWVSLADIPEPRAEGVHCGGRQTLPRAPGHRRARHHPRLHRQPGAARPPGTAARPSPSRW